MHICIYIFRLYVYIYRHAHNSLFSNFCKQKWYHVK